jgi:NnrU protein
MGGDADESWAVLHLIANGDVASFIFFGALAVTALAGTVSIDGKRRRALGPGWQAFAARKPLSSHSRRLPPAVPGSTPAKSRHGGGSPPSSPTH